MRLILIIIRILLVMVLVLVATDLIKATPDTTYYQTTIGTVYQVDGKVYQAGHVLAEDEQSFKIFCRKQDIVIINSYTR